MDAKRLYEDDIVAWAERQAKALRDAAASNSNLPIDWENVAEEIEDLAKAYKSTLKSHLRRIVQHLVKLEHSPALDPRPGWRRTIRLARSEIQDLLEDSPSLRGQVTALIESVMRSAVELAIADLADYDEMNPLRAIVIRRRSYTPDQVLSDWFPDKPEGVATQGEEP